MLNEEKVRYMTELAIFEKNEGKKIFPPPAEQVVRL